MPITETRFSSTSTTSATLEGKYLGESSNISLKLSSLLFKDFKRTVNDAKTPCRIWQLINTPQLQLLLFAGFVPVKQERVKEANEFSRLTRPCWVEGWQPALGGFHDTRLSSSDGMGYTLLCNSTVQVYTAHVGTELHCQHTVQVKCATLCATESWPLTQLQCVRLRLQLYQENWHAAVQQSSSALKYIALGEKNVALNNMAMKCTETHCLGGTWHCVSWAQGSCQKCRTGFYQRPRTNGENEALTHPSQVLQRRSVGESD